jgi:hypothetical protein
VYTYSLSLFRSLSLSLSHTHTLTLSFSHLDVAVVGHGRAAGPIKSLSRRRGVEKEVEWGRRGMCSAGPYIERKERRERGEKEKEREREMTVAGPYWNSVGEGEIWAGLCGLGHDTYIILYYIYIYI